MPTTYHEPSTTVVATDNLDDDAMGLEAFIGAQFAAHQDAVVVYIEDQDGYQATAAEWIKNVLTDGSVTYDLRLTFDR